MEIIKLNGGGQHIHLALEPDDYMKACPFCGSHEIELTNTSRAYYTVCCLNCGAEISGKAYGSNTPSHKLTMRMHKLAKRTAMNAWNRRYDPIKLDVLRTPSGISIPGKALRRATARP